MQSQQVLNQSIAFCVDFQCQKQTKIFSDVASVIDHLQCSPITLQKLQEEIALNNQEVQQLFQVNFYQECNDYFDKKYNNILNNFSQKLRIFVNLQKSKIFQNFQQINKIYTLYQAIFKVDLKIIQDNYSLINELLYPKQETKDVLNSIQKNIKKLDDYENRQQLFQIKTFDELNDQDYIDQNICTKNHQLQWCKDWKSRCGSCQSIKSTRQKCNLCAIRYCMDCRPPLIKSQTCPKGHKMLFQDLYVQKQSNHIYQLQPEQLTIVCDMCHKDAKEFELSYWSDRECNFDICNNCYGDKYLTQFIQQIKYEGM